MGDTAYNLLSADLPTIKKYIDSRRAHGFNYVRFGAGNEVPKTPASVWPVLWPYGGTPHHPDYLQINETLFRHMDRVFDYAETVGMHFEFILWLYGHKVDANWANETLSNFWVDTVVARYGKRPALFMWTVANEFERWPDGDYHTWTEKNVEWAKNIASRIVRTDPVHGISVHPSLWISGFNNYWYTRNGYHQHTPQVAYPLWISSNVSVSMQQNKGGVSPHRKDGGVYTFPSVRWEGKLWEPKWTSIGWNMTTVGIGRSVQADWAEGRKPVIIAEFGYQWVPPCHNESHAEFCVPHSLLNRASTRIASWKIVSNGGYFSAGVGVTYFNISSWNVWYPESWNILYNFITTNIKHGWYKLEPQPALVDSRNENSCMALPGYEYVAYFPVAGTTEWLQLDHGSYDTFWFNPRTGQLSANGKVAVKGLTETIEFHPPSTVDDWVLHITQDPHAQLHYSTEQTEDL